MNRFKAGDRVRVIAKDSLHFGEECTVVADARFTRRIDGRTGERMTASWVYEVDLTSQSQLGLACAYTEDQLKPIYDGNETVSWESCIWQPAPVVTI